MSRALPRTNFNRSRLIRSLSDLSIADIAESNQSLAERLSQWVGVTDAIVLFSALNPGPVHPTDASGEPCPEGVALREELARVRAALRNSISAEDVLKLGTQARVQSPPSTPDTPPGFAVDFLLFRRYYLARQRAMASSIGVLRTKTREALSRCSPKLKQLAELDAALGQALIGREHDSLATVPVFLEKRFEQLRQAHQQALIDTQNTDDPDSWMHPGGWLARFCQDLQDVLLAELDLRLQPVAGMIEAYGNQVTTHQ